MSEGAATRRRHGAGQGNKSRCHNCNHLRGARGLGPTVTATFEGKGDRPEYGKGGRPRTGQPKKASCACECHEVRA